MVEKRTHGGADSFEEWLAARGRALETFAAMMCHQRDDAADALQSALWATYRRWSSLDEPGAAEAYARRCVVNATITTWRKERRQHETRRRLADVPGTTEAADPTARYDDSAILNAALDRLSPAQRATVVLHYYDDWSFERIADLLSCPASTARSHARRALRLLRLDLDTQEARHDA